MQPLVLPDPTAPATKTPVKSPRAGMLSHVGRSDATGSTGWCCSPTTTSGSRREGFGRAGSPPAAPAVPQPRTPHVPQAGQPGAENQHGRAGSERSATPPAGRKGPDRGPPPGPAPAPRPPQATGPSASAPGRPAPPPRGFPGAPASRPHAPRKGVTPAGAADAAARSSRAGTGLPAGIDEPPPGERRTRATPLGGPENTGCDNSGTPGTQIDRFRGVARVPPIVPPRAPGRAAEYRANPLTPADLHAARGCDKSGLQGCDNRKMALSHRLASHRTFAIPAEKTRIRRRIRGVRTVTATPDDAPSEHGLRWPPPDGPGPPHVPPGV